MRRRTAGALALAAGLVLAGCVGGPSTPRAEMLEPWPDGHHVVVDTTDDCRDGESGFGYRFLVVDDPDLDANGAVLDHVRDSGFYRTTLVGSDLSWARVGYQHRDYPVRLLAGPLDRYLAEPAPHHGPPVDDLPPEVRDHPREYSLIALRPTDFTCETPL